MGPDAKGRNTRLGWSGPAGRIADDVVLRSQGGAVVDGTDANPSGPNFTYDTAGRLVAATVPGHAMTYAFASSDGCRVATSAGRNTNRTSTTDTSTIDNRRAETSYCCDHVDRVTSLVVRGAVPA